MKERPILFSAPMVRAILDGSKTQTRRVVKRYELDYPASVKPIPDDLVFQRSDPSFHYRNDCPYGQPGDRLWVREAFHCPGGYLNQYEIDEIAQGISTPESLSITYRADFAETMRPVDGGWKPSIHMRRWASRITLEIVSVRVERLQDISEEDAIAEGAKFFKDIQLGLISSRPCRWSMESPTNTDQCLSTARWAFSNLFCKVNGNSKRGLIDFGPWDANPWVWVVEFERVQP